jgi:hypothetical protein
MELFIACAYCYYVILVVEINNDFTLAHHQIFLSLLDCLQNFESPSTKMQQQDDDKMQDENENTTQTTSPLNDSQDHDDDDETVSSKPIPEAILCPITRDIMIHPVILSSCGHTFESSDIHNWCSTNSNCPVCRKQCSTNNIVSNFALKEMIKYFVDNNLSKSGKRRYLIRRENDKVKRRRLALQQQQLNNNTTVTTTNTMTITRWYWKDSRNWVPYSTTVCNTIAQALASGTTIVPYLAFASYHIDTHQMKQVNTRTGFMREIAKADVSQTVSWEWRSGTNWIPFHPDISEMIEGAVLKQLNPTLVSQPGVQLYEYLIDTIALQQTNVKSGRVRAIRRAP